ncbi:MAG: N-acetyltransferase [Spirochaetota bacterium]
MKSDDDKNNEIKVMRATVEHVNDIFKLTYAMAKKGLMLQRSKYKIITMLGNFFVAVDKDGTVAGCGALTLLWLDMGEIMALAVNDNYRGRGIGKKIVQTLIKEGRRLKVKEIITLTYKTAFFEKLGFTMTDKDHFPRKLWRECLECPKLEECDEIAMHMIL